MGSPGSLGLDPRKLQFREVVHTVNVQLQCCVINAKLKKISRGRERPEEGSSLEPHGWGWRDGSRSLAEWR